MRDHTLTQDPTPTEPTAVALVGLPPTPPGYDLREEVGRGGMGIVYRARDRSLGREVAVKVLAADFRPGSATAARFVEEARITACLQHPGIPAVYQVGTLSDGRPFLAMKLIRGQTLADRLRAGGVVDRLAVIEAVAQAVGYAHAQGVIHRDLKPANIMVGAFGEVQVMDWGVAKELRREDGAGEEQGRNEYVGGPSLLSHTPHPDGLTRAGAVVGTPAYMAPEQAAGDAAKIDCRSDVFGLGAVLCVLLTGKPPYVGEDALSTHELAARAELADAHARLAGCGADPDVVALCRRCLSVDPADRPADGTAVAAAVADLRRAADDRARQADRDRLAAEVRATELVKRRRAGLWVGGGLAAVLLTGVATTSIGLIEATTARRTAETAHRETEQQRADAVVARGAEAGLRATAEAKEKETAAVFGFFQDRVVAAASPKGKDGGLGPDVKLKDALTAGLAAIPKAFADQPLVEARLRMALGRSFLYLGEPATAVAQATLARKLFVAARGPDDPDALLCLAMQGDGLFVVGDRSGALAAQEEAVARLTAVIGPDNPDTLHACSALAFSYHTAGRHADAFRLQERTAERMAAVHGPDHPATLKLVGHLAAGYTQQGRHADAIRLHERALAGMTAKLGPDDPAVLAAANNLATGLTAAGRTDDAFRVYEDTLARRERVLGPDHPSTMVSQHNLAVTYAHVGRFADAARLGEEAAGRRTAKLGRDHINTLRSVAGVADVYTKLGRHADALPLWEEVVGRMTAAHPPDHSELLPAAHKLAEALAQAGRGAEAVQRIDAGLARAGKAAKSQHVEKLLDVRLRHFEKAGDPAGCRATAERWEATAPADADDRLVAACYRGATARAYTAASQPVESMADADRAMAWLTKAVAAGLTDRGQIEKEDDLSALRDRADYRALVAPLVERAPPPRPAESPAGVVH